MTASSALPSHTPVLVVGAGPTGLTVANLLAQAGIDVLIIDREPEPLNLPRAIVLDDEGMRVMQALGLSDTIGSMTRPGSGAQYFDDTGKCFAETGAGAETYGFFKRNYLFQPDLERVLLDQLEQRNRTPVRFGTELISLEQNERGVEAKLKTLSSDDIEITADWVLACDGGRSSIRQAFGIEMIGETYGQDWLVVDLLKDEDDSGFSKFFCNAARPHVSIPAPRGGRRYEFMVMPEEDGIALLEAEQLQELLKPYRSFRDAEVIRKAVYTFHARMAAKWQEGRVFLLGDAAHLTPPFAGQGMNAGLRDAHNLAWKIGLVVQGAATHELLQTYEDERRDPAWSMIQLAVAMGKFVMPRDSEQARFRDALIAAIRPFPAVQKYLMEMKFKPQPRYNRGLFLDLENQAFRGSMVGEMAPQPSVQANSVTAKLDDLLGTGFAVVAQNAECEAAFQSSTHPLWETLDTRLVSVDLKQTARRGDDRAKAWLSHRDQLVLVRPDRYVAAAFDPEDIEASAHQILSKLNGDRALLQAAQ